MVKDLVTQFAEMAADLRDAMRPDASEEKTRIIIGKGIIDALMRAGFSAERAGVISLTIAGAATEEKE